MISSESVSHTESDQYVFHVCVWNVYADFFKETDSIPIARGRVYLSVTFFFWCCVQCNKQAGRHETVKAAWRPVIKLFTSTFSGIVPEKGQK